MVHGAGSPHMADGTDLERWADQRSAQADLPRLVRRIIRQENDQVHRVEMRGGEGVVLSGYDGIVEATRSTSFVPEGLSVWEMGTNKDPAGKATDDYNSRTANCLGVDKSKTTFVFLTPRRWPKKRDWEQARRDEGKWADVRVLDADDIEQALEVAPAARIWLSELLDMPALGVATIEEWWRRFSNGFDPRLTPGVVLAGREDHAADLVRRLSVDVGRTYVKAASVDDGLAFVACAMMAQGVAEAEPMLSRSLLVHDGLTLRRLDSTSKLLVLLPFEEKLHREAQLIENHHVVFVVTDGDASIELPPLDHLTLEAALREAGVRDSELTRQVRAGTKSLVALQRVSGRFEHRDPDQWSEDLGDRVVRRAWLAGAWNHLRSGDLEVLQALTEDDADGIEERLHEIVRQPDPLFTRVGGTWAVAAPEDSWRTTRHLIREADLVALERAVQDVLGAVDPRLELPPEERWSAEIYGKSRIHSTDLRNGLARSIALLGSRGDEVRLSGGRSARLWAERVVWSLLQRANEDATAHLWASMDDVMPLLAEAAPDVFLRAAAEGASGSRPLLGALFQDKDDAWHVSSPHTGMLWALETVAWSQAHFGFAVETLAKLADIDPGGRLSNRPAASLRDIFRPWFPQTSAPADTRLLTLDALLPRHPEVTWTLLLSLLPESHEVGMHTHKPRFRDWAPEDAPKITRKELFDMVDAVARRVVELATQEPRRWVHVVPEFDRMTAEPRWQATSAIEVLNREALEPGVARGIWDAIGEFVRRHRQFPDADWSLPEEWLEPLEAAGDHLRPDRSADIHRWLFDDWTPDIGVSVSEDFAAYESAVQQERDAAASEILAEGGFDAVVEVAKSVKLPWAVGAAAARVSDQHDCDALALLDSDEGRLVQFADGFARRRSAEDVESIERWLSRFEGRPLVQARLLQTIPSFDTAWGLLRGLSDEVDQAYWAEFVPYGRGTDFPQVNEVARQLLNHGRAAMAIDTLSLYAERSDVDVDVVIQALTQFGTTPDPETGRVSEHDLTSLFDYLRSHGVDELEIARFEWKFLPALHVDSKTPSLQRLLARDPESFVQLVKFAFKRAGGEPDADATGEGEQVGSAMASNAFRLLREWQVVPGTNDDGRVDSEALNGWLAEVRVLLEDADRLDIGELQIGEVFAHAPSDSDGTFPTRPVRDVLEAAPNDRLERGFVIGLHNKRGVTSRGLTDGGQQEYDLAERYDAWAKAVESTHPRTAGALRSVAESYREEGRRNDDEVRRYLEGLDR
jgi:hypothetical protein